MRNWIAYAERVAYAERDRIREGDRLRRGSRWLSKATRVRFVRSGEAFDLDFTQILIGTFRQTITWCVDTFTVGVYAHRPGVAKWPASTLLPRHVPA
jgi:hypothetical protein